MRIIAIGNDFSRVKPFKESEKVTQPKEPAKQENKAVKTEKVLPLASAALAAISLGVAIYATRGRNSEATKKEATRIAEETAEKVKKPLQESIDKLTKEVNGVTEKVTGLGKDVENASGIAKKAEETLNAVNGIKENVESKLTEIGNRSHNFIARTVEVNGKHLELATVMHGYGPKEHILSQELQTESARRILASSSN